jgi:hypothetical protein
MQIAARLSKMAVTAVPNVRVISCIFLSIRIVGCKVNEKKRKKEDLMSKGQGNCAFFSNFAP